MEPKESPMYQRGILKCVELDTWEEATEALPEFTQALKKFPSYKFQGKNVYYHNDVEMCYKLLPGSMEYLRVFTVLSKGADWEGELF